MSDGPGERRPPEPGLKAPEESFDAAAGTVPDEAAGSSSDEAFEPESEAQARVEREAVSLTRRLRQPRTILSIAVPAAIIAFFVWKNGAEFGKVPGIIAHANVMLLVAAFLMYYAGFPIRGYRWARLLRGTGFAIRTRDATEIIFLSWLVNCVVPAKLGDVYRAWLLKMNSEASLSRTFGTVFIERILDLFAIAILGLAAGFWSFRNGLPPAIQIVAVLGVVVVVALAVLLMTMRNFGRAIIVRLPLPVRFIELYDRFEHGVFGAVGLRDLPPLAVLTVLVWVTESLRLYLVVRALGLPGVDLGLSGSVFVALIGSLLTAVPLTPAGLGVVDGGMIFVLTTAYGISIESAGAIVLLDRAISVFTIIILGALAYVVSAKPRGEGRIDGTPAPALRVAPGRPGGGR
ncbi:MAG: lysylphosphatidylglycerol synthase transmembrane domain-containing protein [Candidatus Limnocylindrales bacterium]